MEKKTFDYPVMPLEGLWWGKDNGVFRMNKRDEWLWTLMIMQPEVITPAVYREGIAAVRKKKQLAALGRERMERFEEGLSAQILHTGPYSAEGPTIEKLHGFISEKGLRFRGKHHEIYLGDPRRGNPANLKTLVRQPVQKISMGKSYE